MNTPLLRVVRFPLGLASWLTFAISLTFYWITADPGASYWDCPEYVVNASKLEVGHPPGNPIWMLAMRVATIPFSPANHAYVINLCSGIFTAFAAFFLCRVIFVSLLLVTGKPKRTKRTPSGLYDISSTDEVKNRKKVYFPNSSRILSLFFISLGGALCFSLCDSVWFSAIEAEVYAMSVFLVAASLWVLTLWYLEKPGAKAYRLMILLAYITGLSLGVHQLNLLLIPVFLTVWAYKQNPIYINPFRLIFWALVGIILVGCIIMLFLPSILFGASQFELFAVNGAGLPYDRGVLIFILVITLLFIVALLFFSSFRSYQIKKSRKTFYLLSRNSGRPSLMTKLQVCTWMAAFIFLGFSSFGIIMIRSKAAPFMNEGTPDNIFSLASYVNRDQYPANPLLYGETPFSKPIIEESIVDGKPQYLKYHLAKGKPVFKTFNEAARLYHRSGLMSTDDSLFNSEAMEKGHGYLLADYNFSQVLTPELNMWFPRITSRNLGYLPAYEDWAGMNQENMEKISVSEVIDEKGRFLTKLSSFGNRDTVWSYRPTYLQNLRYFLAYQSYYMYFRYLFWNFIGRQNDLPSTGEIDHGNFITGVPIIDKELVGDTDFLPSELWGKNKGRNRYFAIPFLLGLLGIMFLAYLNRRSRRLFFITFLMFLMTGLAIVGYLNQTPSEPRERDYTFLANYLTFAIWISAGFLWIATISTKWLNHKISMVLVMIVSLGCPTLMALENFDDHDRRGRFEPSFYASSWLDFETPAIIFTQGDNGTYPVWYATEVLGLGRQHIPIDVTYLTWNSYVANLKKQGDRSIKTNAGIPDILYGKYLFTKIPADKNSQPIPLHEALASLYNSDEDPPEWPSSLIIVSGKEEKVINLHKFTKGGSYLPFASLMLLDIIDSNKDRSLFFPLMIERSFYQPLDSLLMPALFGKIYSPDLDYNGALELMKISIDRELGKLNLQTHRPNYLEPVLAERSARYRGELLIAANKLLEAGDTIYPVKIIDAIEVSYPYQTLPPSTFTVSDSTYYEGKEYLYLLRKMRDKTGNKRFMEMADSQDSLLSSRKKEWLRYYNSLSPAQRKVISNSSKRILR